MSEYFDPNKAVAEAVTSLAAKAADKIVTKGTKFVRGLGTDLRLLTSSHKRYIGKVSKDFYRAKSFLNPHTKKPLYDFFVPLGISRGDTRYEEASIENLTLVENFNVLTGLGGCGKSMMMRHLFLDTLRVAERVPILVELRDLNDGKTKLYDLVRKALFDNGFVEDDSFFKKAMTAGHFAIFLDGFDESNNPAETADAILHLARDFEKNVIVVSSRPDDLFSSWQSFNEWKVQPLTLEKACDLVDKVPTHIFDQKIQQKFIEDLRAKLFRTHTSFLSNPLLLSIMILTYRDSAEIPTKLSVFYDQAYSTLFQRHDALKGGYKRKRETLLDIQDFSKVFSAFAVLTFDKRKTTFSDTEILHHLRNAKKFLSVDFSEECFLKDAIQAVSLLVRDGINITFSHRSFQEYFTALFISQATPEIKIKLIAKYRKNYFQDSVMQLLHNLEPELVEKEVIIPEINDLESAIEYKGTVSVKEYKKFLRIVIDGFTVVNKSKSRILLNPKSSGNSSCVWLLRFMRENYDIGYKGIHENPTYLAFEERVGAVFPKILSNESDEISISKIFSSPELVEKLSAGNHALSMSTLARVLDIKALLIGNHEKIDASIEAALMLN